MGRPSSIARLPASIREEIGNLRGLGKTIDEILDHLRALAVEVSRSALGRHVASMEKVGERLRRSRTVTEALVRQLGDAPESKTARLNIELMHSFIYDLLALSEEETEEGAATVAMLRNPKAVALLAEAAERLTKASRHNVEFIAAAEKRAAEKAKREAATAVAAEARRQGMSAETAEAFKAAVFGVAS